MMSSVQIPLYWITKKKKEEKSADIKVFILNQIP